MKAELYCIHGFLGAAADWDSVLPSDCAARNIDWLRDRRFNEFASLEALGESVNRWARGEGSASARRILVGYSMGGRVALHALFADTDFWDAAIIISSHPGLSSDAERGPRLENDRAWARRFETENWNAVVSDWDAQPVFTGELNPFRREETPGLREALVRALEKGSLAKQRDFRPELATVQKPILWMAGERDAKYLQLARDCARLNPRFSFAEIPGAGHRAPWTAKDEFGTIFQSGLDGRLS